MLRYVNEVPVLTLAGLLGISWFAMYRRLAAVTKKFRENLKKEGIGWVWVISALVFVLSTAGAAGLPADAVWVISALMPLLALTVVSESGRSEHYEMAELEMATRFSLRSVVLARLGILGTENLILLGLLLPVWSSRPEGSVVQTGVCVLLPYLMTAFSGLWVVRRIRGCEAVYICAGIAACIGFLMAALYGGISQSCQADGQLWWMVGRDSIVLLSTHIVSDIEHIADEVLMMKDGQLIYQGKWDDKRGDLETFYLEQFGEERTHE